MLWWLLACTCDPSQPEPPTALLVEEQAGEGVYQRGPDLDDEMAMLLALGYADAGEQAGDAGGVLLSDDAPPGRVLYSSGHGPEAVLMELDGTVRHRWRRAFEDVFDAPKAGVRLEGTTYWRRVHAFPDGSLLAIFEGQGLVKLDRHSNVLWSSDRRVHHHLDVADDGVITTLDRIATVYPQVNPKRAVLEDRIVQFAPEGEVMREVSVLRSLLRSPFASQWEPRKLQGDVFHTNAAVVLDERFEAVQPEWKAGRVMVSVRAWHALMVIDLDQEEVVWVGKGSWRRQHDPRLLDNGNLLLFDNLGLGKRSRVLELNPADNLEVAWSYEGSEEHPFFSRFCGAASRLDNGSTMISDSWSGRAFIVGPDDTLQWWFASPHRAPSDPEKVAVLPEMMHLPATYGDDWL